MKFIRINCPFQVHPPGIQHTVRLMCNVRQRPSRTISPEPVIVGNAFLYQLLNFMSSIIVPVCQRRHDLRPFKPGIVQYFCGKRTVAMERIPLPDEISFCICHDM